MTENLWLGESTSVIIRYCIGNIPIRLNTTIPYHTIPYGFREQYNAPQTVGVRGQAPPPLGEFTALDPQTPYQMEIRARCSPLQEHHPFPSRPCGPWVYSPTAFFSQIEQAGLVFTAGRVCVARTRPWRDVCRSVRLSHAGILSKRLFIHSNWKLLYNPQSFFSQSRSPTILGFACQTG